VVFSGTPDNPPITVRSDASKTVFYILIALLLIVFFLYDTAPNNQFMVVVNNVIVFFGGASGGVFCVSAGSAHALDIVAGRN
jgi:hypothetical protein